MTILTISSQVLYGHVGNAVADFTLKRMGHPVIAVPTVLLSNHKGYSDTVGEIFGPDLLRDLFSALERRGALDDIKAIQTGFIATVGQAQNIFDFLGCPFAMKIDRFDTPLHQIYLNLLWDIPFGNIKAPLFWP